MKPRGILLSHDLKPEYVHGAEGVVFAGFPPVQGSKAVQLEFTAEAAEKLAGYLMAAAEEARPSEEDEMMTWPQQLKGGE